MSKKFIAAVCIGCLAVIGYKLTRDDSMRRDSLFIPQNTLQAATLPSWKYDGQLPLDVQLDLAKKIKPDTVVIHDTVTVSNIKYVRVPVPRHTTDTILVPLGELQEVVCMPVKNRSPGVREEQSLDESVAKTGIVLIVDGNTVYTSSKSESHSGGNPEGATSVDEP